MISIKPLQAARARGVSLTRSRASWRLRARGGLGRRNVERSSAKEVGGFDILNVARLQSAKRLVSLLRIAIAMLLSLVIAF